MQKGKTGKGCPKHDNYPLPCLHCRREEERNRPPNLEDGSLADLAGPVKKVKIPLLRNTVQQEFDRQINQQTAKTQLKVIDLAIKLKYKPEDYLLDSIKLDKNVSEDYQCVKQVEKKLNKLYQKEADKKNCKNKNPRGAIAYWITISPPSPHDILSELQKIMEYLTSTSLFTESEYSYVYEWRDHHQQIGCHVHLLLHRNAENKNSPAKQLRPFDSLTEWGITSQNKFASVYVEYVKNDYGLLVCDKYLSGAKKEDKTGNVEADRDLRKQLGLEDIYSK